MKCKLVDVLDDQQEMIFAKIMTLKSGNKDEVRRIGIEVVYLKR